MPNAVAAPINQPTSINKFFSLIYKAFMLASAICFIISFSTSGMSSFGATMAGYGMLIMAVFLILLNLVQTSLAGLTGKSIFYSMLIIIMTVGPFFLLLGTVGFLMYLLITYKTPILADQVPPYYAVFNRITLAFLLLQLFIAYYYMNTPEYQKTNKMSKIGSALMYLFGVFALTGSLGIYVALTYFRTDG